MSYGALKTLFLMLQAAPSMVSASVVYGEEMINAQDQTYPMVAIVPIGGSWQQPGYYQDGSTEINNSWMTSENIDLYLGAWDPDPAATPIDHANALEDFRAAVLQAFQYQSPTGLMYRPISGRWVLAQDVINRMGRAYILTVQCDITIPDLLPRSVEVEEITISPTFEE